MRIQTHCKYKRFPDGSLVTVIKIPGFTDTMQYHTFVFDHILPFPPLDTKEMNLITFTDQTPAKLIDPFFSTTLHPGVYGIIDKGDLHSLSLNSSYSCPGHSSASVSRSIILVKIAPKITWMPTATKTIEIIAYCISEIVP